LNMKGFRDLKVYLYSLFVLVFFFLATLLPAFSEDFQAVKGWTVLDMHMTAEEAKDALNKAGIAFEEEMFEKEGLIYFTLTRDDGYEGTIYFEFTEDGKDIINQILFQSPYLKSEAEAEEALKAMEEKYGNPLKTENYSYSDGTSTSSVYCWENENTLLTIDITHYIQEDNWVVWEKYTPLE